LIKIFIGTGLALVQLKLQGTVRKTTYRMGERPGDNKNNGLIIKIYGRASGTKKETTIIL